MLLADMTYIEVERYLENNNGIIIPIGTCEQHGAHLPLNNDILGVEYFAKVMSEKTGLLVAPTVNYGVNLPCDKSMFGTTSINAEILSGIILSITDWWRSQGFRRFFILTFHGDPFHIKALSNLSNDIFLIEPWEIEYGDVLEKQATMKHACEAETSVALYLYPGKVRMNLIKEHDIPYEVFEDYLFHRNEGKPDNYVGNLGFPSSATADKGEILVKRMIEKMMSDYIALETESSKK